MGLPRYAVLFTRMRPEKMRMQLAAEELMKEIDRLLPLVKRVLPNAADHLERSCEAVLFKIGEGIGAFQPKVKIAAYEIAKKEMNEARAILRRLVIKRALTEGGVRRSYNLIGAVIGMLTNAIKGVEKRI